jgi:hypothetical protein
LDIDMLKLRHNAREAQAELAAMLQGRLPFLGGGGRVAEFPKAMNVRLKEWEEKRQELLRTMAPAVSPDGYIRLWMQVEPGPSADAAKGANA